VLKVSGDGVNEEAILTFPNGPVALTSTGLYFSLVQRFYLIRSEELGNDWKVSTRYYQYTVETEDAEEIIGYHWHPQSVSPINYPHMHLGAGARIGRKELDSAKAHLPTGRVAIEDVIHLLIEVFDVEPLKKNWKQLVHSNLSRFLKHATWGSRRS
jgi:hypothetical protein